MTEPQQCPLLNVHNLQVSYGAIRALRGVSLYVNEGEIVCVIGANGAGKSTLMNALMVRRAVWCPTAALSTISAVVS